MRRGASGYRKSQHRTKTRLRTPVSQVAVLCSCGAPGPCHLQCARLICPYSGPCLTPGQTPSPPVRGRMDRLLYSRPGDITGRGGPTLHTRSKDEDRLLRVRLLRALTLGGSWSERQDFPKCTALCSLPIDHEMGVIIPIFLVEN